ISGLRRIGENLDDQRGIKQGIYFRILEERLTANDSHIGIVILIALRHAHSLISAHDDAGLSLQLLSEPTFEVPGNQVMFPGRACHRDDHAVVVLALCLGLPFTFQVLLRRQARLLLRFSLCVGDHRSFLSILLHRILNIIGRGGRSGREYSRFCAWRSSAGRCASRVLAASGAALPPASDGRRWLAGRDRFPADRGLSGDRAVPPFPAVPARRPPTPPAWASPALR